jgi:hypothetical protein
MKRIIRLTENDLARIVRRVINENTQSFDIVELTDQNKGTNVTLTDGKGRNILSTYKVNFPKDGIGIFGKPGINMEEGEQITASITLDSVWMVDGTVLNKNQNPDFTFDMASRTATLKFNIPNQDTFNNSSFIPSVKLKCKNIKGGELSIFVGLPETTVISESYRRRYRRY